MKRAVLSALALSACTSIGTSPDPGTEPLLSTRSFDPPKLQRELAVDAPPPKPGEPTSLFGGAKMLCATRHEAPTACIGSIHLDLVPVDPAQNDGRYRDGHTERPVAIEDFDFSGFSANDRVRCVVRDGSLYCWRSEQYGGGRGIPQRMPIDDVVTSENSDGICAVQRDGNLGCFVWSFCPSSEPRRPEESRTADVATTVEGLGPVRDVAMGGSLKCGVHFDNTVSCWEFIGGSDAECSDRAIRVENLASVHKISVSARSACALRSDNRVLCWGLNRWQALGVPDPAKHYLSPVAPKLPASIVDLQLMYSGAALSAKGTIWIWGEDFLGEDGPADPAKLQLGLPALDFQLLEGFGCALLTDRTVQCWGSSVDLSVEKGRGRPPFEGKAVWVDAPRYRLASPAPAQGELP